MADTVATPKTKVKIKTERPRLHKVILINDDFTPREFVVTVLKAEFRMAHRLSAKSANKVLLCEAGQDTPPGNEPPEIRDSYPGTA